MPLNLKNNADDEPEQEENHGPILHQPGIQPHISHALIISVILIVLLAVAGFAVYKSGVWKRLRSARTEQAPPASAPAESPVPQQAPAAAADTPRTGAAPAVRESVPPATGGNYTIYVARQAERTRADEEAARWNEAGYSADVVERDGWYCVAVGRYATWEEARGVAEKLKEGLEGGYWISTRP